VSQPMPQSKPAAVPQRQQQVLDFIDAQLKAGKPFPGTGAIARHMGWKAEASALDCLYRLAWRGMVEREASVGVPRSKQKWSRRSA
jgi:hypothetical protein